MTTEAVLREVDDTSFMTDVKTLRARARREIDEGAVTPAYGLAPEKTVELLNIALATELVCTLRYRQHAFSATGIQSEPIAREFKAHSDEELGHADALARRIVQLGGQPEMDPAQLTGRSHAEYTTCSTLKEMIRENLVAERIAIESYQEMIRFFSDKDPTTRALLERILAKEEEHADELADLMD